MTQQLTGVEPIVRSVTVRVDQKAAFDLFTKGIASWWPLGTHSVFQEEGETVFFEQHEGGRIFERTPDGKEADWGSVLAWEPPDRVVYDWHPEPGSIATEVEVRFSPEGDATRVELEHRGWERLGDNGPAKRASYNAPDGWDQVIGWYVRRAG